MKVSDLETGKYYCYSSSKKQARVQYLSYHHCQNPYYQRHTRSHYDAVYVFLFIEYLWRDVNAVRRKPRKQWLLDSDKVNKCIYDESEFIITKL